MDIMFARMVQNIFFPIGLISSYVFVVDGIASVI